MWQLCSSLNEIESVDRTCFKIEYSSSEPIAPAKISTKLQPQKLKPNSILKLRRICCVSWAKLNSLEKLSCQRFLGWVFLCLLRKQFHHLSSVFWQTHLVPYCLQELWICYDTKRFFFSANSNASESNCFVLPPSFCLPERENFSRHFICELGFLRWFLPSLQDESITLFSRTNLRKYFLKFPSLC